LASSHQKVKSLDLLIISGGGQLTEKSGPWAFPYTIFKWIALARTAGVRCVFLNVGAGPLTRPVSKFFVRRALCSADYVSLRDEKSQALVHDIGFNGKTRAYPDSAYALEIATTAKARKAASQSIVGLAPMPYPDEAISCYRRPDENQVIYESFIEKLADFASWLTRRSHVLSLFGTDFGVDPQTIKDLQSALSSRHKISLPPCNVNESITSVQGLLAAISGMDYVVTCRFHGVVFAHLLNKPVLAIAPHAKVAELMADLELSSYCVDIRDFDSTLLADRFSSMVNNAEEIRIRMAARLTRNRQQLRDQFDELFRNSREAASALEQTVS
jgi:polysaccharide pyruvyl transferase WcaK-like protein